MVEPQADRRLEETFTEQYEFRVAAVTVENGRYDAEKRQVYNPQSRLAVRAIDSRVPVISLEFNGYSAVRGGDTITARVLRFRGAKQVPLGKVEEALEIRIHGEGVLDTRIERSTDYGRFFAPPLVTAARHQLSDVSLSNLP